jgi:hypothetical protein
MLQKSGDGNTLRDDIQNFGGRLGIIKSRLTIMKMVRKNEKEEEIYRKSLELKLEVLKKKIKVRL